jgi:uncharacterized DUF497 family protein
VGSEKAASNLAKHGVAFEEIERFEWEAGVYADQIVFGEARVQVYGPIGERLFACVFVQRGDVRRIVSLRKANKREMRQYLAARGDL